MATIADKATFKAGQPALLSGGYDCDAGCGHHWHTSEPNEILPELPEDCTGDAWLLRREPAG
ncbi:hypothetical protein [Amycolatopsis aidingensis]|uniref:hypothetical protein n=1 Tax=Amycolatopsis aidingensis TaxID=2842453 RepID=UPI001C0BD058|nr:hypothetical protein [Amycolatopsis aidingensis]